MSEAEAVFKLLRELDDARLQAERQDPENISEALLAYRRNRYHRIGYWLQGRRWAKRAKARLFKGYK